MHHVRVMPINGVKFGDAFVEVFDNRQPQFHVGAWSSPLLEFCVDGFANGIARLGYGTWLERGVVPSNHVAYPTADGVVYFSTTHNWRAFEFQGVIASSSVHPDGQQIAVTKPTSSCVNLFDIGAYQENGEVPHTMFRLEHTQRTSRLLTTQRFLWLSVRGDRGSTVEVFDLESQRCVTRMGVSLSIDLIVQDGNESVFCSRSYDSLLLFDTRCKDSVCTIPLFLSGWTSLLDLTDNEIVFIANPLTVSMVDTRMCREVLRMRAPVDRDYLVWSRNERAIAATKGLCGTMLKVDSGESESWLWRAL